MTEEFWMRQYFKGLEEQIANIAHDMREWREATDKRLTDIERAILSMQVRAATAGVIAGFLTTTCIGLVRLFWHGGHGK